MTKQIEDYPELKEIVTGLKQPKDIPDYYLAIKEVEQKLLSMQETIRTQRSLEAQLQGEINDLEVRVHEQQSKIDSLTEQNKELQEKIESYNSVTELNKESK